MVYGLMVYYGPLNFTQYMLRKDQQNIGATYSLGSCPFASVLMFSLKIDSHNYNSSIIQDSWYMHQLDISLGIITAQYNFGYGKTLGT